MNNTTRREKCDSRGWRISAQRSDMNLSQIWVGFTNLKTSILVFELKLSNETLYYSRAPKSEHSDFGQKRNGSVVKQFRFQTLSEIATWFTSFLCNFRPNGCIGLSPGVYPYICLDLLRTTCWRVVRFWGHFLFLTLVIKKSEVNKKLPQNSKTHSKKCIL